LIGAKLHNLIKQAKPDVAFALIVSGAESIKGKRTRKDMAVGQEVMNPLTAVGHRHEAEDDLTVDDISEASCLLSLFNMLPI
jgi:hypothetical protein